MFSSKSIAKRLTLRERRKIEALYRDGLPVSRIAVSIGRGVSCVQYEINTRSTSGGYCASVAHEQARKLQKTAHSRGKVFDRMPEVKEVVIYLLRQHWSPEAICVELLYMNEEWSFSPNTVYSFIYSEEGRSLDLSMCLMHPRFKRKRRRGTPQKYDRYAPTPRSGWETDTMFFEGSSLAVSVSVHCQTLCVVLSLMECEDVMQKADALRKVIVMGDARHITYDQREENGSLIHFRRYHGVASAVSNGPHEKPVVENTIKFLRPYFRLLDTTKLTEEQIGYIEESYNNKRRKKLGWRRPSEVFALFSVN